MNALVRLVRSGAADADRTIAALLAPRALDSADRYLATSVIVRAVDGGTLRLRNWWRASGSYRRASALAAGWSDSGWAQRYRAIGTTLLVAAAFHAALTIAQGARPGWFWMVVPAMAIAFGLLLLTASRQSRSAP